MRLAGIEVRDFRSIFLDEGGASFGMELGSGMNTLVGLNNCGKSNVLRAISLALDPELDFDPEWDAPGPRPFAPPIITLRFIADGDRSEEREALDTARAYEVGLGVPASVARAADRQIVLQVTFRPERDGFRRRELLLTRTHATPTRPEDFERLETALARLREAVRFVLISSGESIESVLEGNFREILHSVVRERLSEAFSEAEQSRREYVTGLQESLLAPLRERLTGDVGGLFPEIATTQLAPDVPSIEETLSRVEVNLGDLVATPLDQKGTGVRGGVLVAMLSYLALNATRGMVFAVEEPEAFLHPASQEDVRDLLEAIGAASGVTLLVTTHSPYLVTVAHTGRIFSLAKDLDGRTRLSQVASGDAPHAPLIGGLLRERSLRDLVAHTTELPEGAKAVLLVEGDGDELSLRLAAHVVGRSDLLDDIYIRPAGGTNKMAVEAVIARAATDKPVFVLVDNDEHGIGTVKLLCGEKFRFQKKQQVATYAEVFPGGEHDFPYEAEDLFDPELIQAFVDRHEPPIHEGSKKRPDGAFHYDFGQAAKGELESYLHRETRAQHVRRWIELILLLRDRLGLSIGGESVDQIIDAAPAPTPDKPEQMEGRVLVLVDKLDHSRYQSSRALVLDTDHHLPPGVTHIGFYVEGAIQPVVPRIVGDFPALFFSESTVAQLRATGRQQNVGAADVIEASLRLDDDLAQSTHRILLLSGPDDPETLEVHEPVRNTKQRSGRPLAWAVAPRTVNLSSLAQSPATTDELDELEAERSNGSQEDQQR